ncbi:ABC transporter ATP-binding protein [Agrobacterium sp. BA1120]|uniref:ABC transporter ATP-binding protein n=1 Tax=Agrobacterium sp. BA1120 TaxID=3228927 RepID=UPI00336AC758
MNMNVSNTQIHASAASDNPLKLRAQKLSKHYGPVVALDNVSIEVRAGEFVSLLGPSGSGKTTLLTLIAGLATPDGGQLWIDEREATYLPIQKRDLGMVFQNYALFPHLSVAENIAFPLRMRHVPEAEIRVQVRQALETIRLGHVADRLPQALSGGQQQRVALARCLVYKPSIILMDEPLGALDRNLREEMQYEIKELHRQLGTTIIYVTHDQDEAMTMSDRVCLMQSGGIVQLGAPQELYFHPRTQFAASFLGDSNFMDGVLLGYEGEVAVIEAADGSKFRAPKSLDNLTPGTSVQIMFRPEHVTISGKAAPEQDNVVSATVRDTVLVGGTRRIFFDGPASTPISMSCLSQFFTEGVERGSALSLSFPVSFTRYFPKGESK